MNANVYNALVDLVIENKVSVSEVDDKLREREVRNRDV